MVSGSPLRRSLFASSSASRIARWNSASTPFNLSGLTERMSTSIHDSNGIEFTDVPPPILPTLYDVRGPLDVNGSATATNF